MSYFILRQTLVKTIVTFELTKYPFFLKPKPEAQLRRNLQLQLPIYNKPS